MSDSRAEQLVQDCYSTWSESYYEDYYGPDAAYPPIHRGLIADVLDDQGSRTILDAGCGPASLLRDLDRPDRGLYGFDLTPEMVESGRKALASQGHPAARVWTGSVVEAASFRCPAEPEIRFDAALCCGVLPHVPEREEAAVLGHLRDCVRPGGVVVVEARNALFGLFTLNRYTWELFRDDLVGAEDLAALARPEERQGLQTALSELHALLRTDEPPVRAGDDGEPGYDEVLSRTHNPLALAEAARAAGLTGVRLLHYHYHALPPMLARHAPDLARRASLAMEDPTDPRGLVMASAFLVVGVAP